mmetsp:Transcript_25451/g.71176  ORF Transcript_25451/g.71176 Transcript_25451/m.71176 type:complete len:1296 (-) Transcript_25451:578-4465(-)|eukprot:CAMPEP_0117660682 /NCGR_PEP_ID=MMETSP0804-20121206/7095_1 /TAXON_ID=1074897 /ORGANISM="Tetraselmis astigmatica, Strain CCMP880" /LENGTH=1295 /DNA_ID=CAMNT_0005467421 /DNA_START=180 /DNA_END=4067 /DNA_ORIENTATION=-
MTSRPSTAGVVLGSAAAVAVAGAYLYLKSVPRNQPHAVVFLDSGEGTSGLQLHGVVVPLAGIGSAEALARAAASALNLTSVDLFVQSTKVQVTQSNLSAALLEAGMGLSAPVLIATVSGAGLSAASAAASPLERLPTGPTSLPVLGNALGVKNGPYKVPFHNAWVNFFGSGTFPHGKTIRLKLPVVNGEFQREHYRLLYNPCSLEGVIMTADCVILEDLIGRQGDFPKMWTGVAQDRIAAFAANGLFTDHTSTDRWKTGHGVIPRSFNAVRVKNYFPVLLEKTQVFIHAWAGFGNGSKVEHVHDWLTCMTADAVTKCAMDLDMDNIGRKSRGEGLHPLIEAFRMGLGWATKTLKPEAVFGTFNAKYNPFFDTTKHYDEILTEATKTCEEYISDTVERTRKGEIGGSMSVLSAMLNNASQETGELIKYKEFYGHIMTIMIAGHETTAAALAHLFVELCWNPEVHAKCVKEIEEVLDGRVVPTYEDIGKLTYLGAAFKEALRKYPSVPSLNRDVGEDTLLGGKFLVRKGTRVIINNYALHRDPDQWDQGVFGDVDSFNPDRHLPGAPPRHANAFLPFGYGIRGCIGQQLAQLEAKIFLCMVLNFFTFKLPEGFKLVSSNEDGGASAHPQDFHLIISARPGGPMDKAMGIVATCDWTKGALGCVPPAADPSAGSAGPACAAAGNKMHGTKLHVLFGSNSGTCEDFAQTFGATARNNGYSVELSNLDAAIEKGLPGKGSAVVIISSTYNGLPPNNAGKFLAWLQKQQPGSLAGNQFAVFGVGNSNWEATFHKCPREIHTGLVSAGATPLRELAGTDVSSAGFTEEWEEWMEAAMVTLSVAFGLSGATATSCVQKQPTYAARLVPEGHGDKPTLHSFAEAQEYVWSKVGATLSSLGGDALRTCKVTSTKQLQSEDSQRATMMLEIELPEGAIGYTAGDHLEVAVPNDPVLVETMLRALNLDGSTPCELDLTLSVRNKKLIPMLKAGNMTHIPSDVQSVLAWVPDLSKPPSRKVVAALADRCECPPEKKALLEMADPEEYKEKVLKTGITMAEIMLKYRSVKVTFPEVITNLQRLSSRYYSISSSPLVAPRRVAITVGLVKYTTGTGRMHLGTSSGLIHSLKDGGTLFARVHSLSADFKLPKEDSQPIIMIGPGTGVAPFMGFMEERAVKIKGGAKMGPAHLFFGCRSAATDFIYRELLESYTKNGVLSPDGLHVAFSRDNGHLKLYVQDLVRGSAAQIWELLQHGANVYVCGDAKRMAPDVRKAFQEVAMETGAMTEKESELWMSSLVSSSRYLEDVWAG